MDPNRFSQEPIPIRLPQPPAAAITPVGFTMCPVGCCPGLTIEQWFWQQWLYQRAFELAQATVRPSLLERDLLAVWN